MKWVLLISVFSIRLILVINAIVNWRWIRIKRVFNETVYEKLLDYLNGPTGTVFCTGNAAAIAKVVLQTAETFSDIKIKGNLK